MIHATLRTGPSSALLVGASLLLLASASAAQSSFGELRRMLPSDVDATVDLATADVDGDGDLDAVFAGPRAKLLLNDGAGTFADASAQLPDPSDETTAVAFGDVDGDGDVDVVLGKGSTNPQPDLLFLNDGSGTFAVSAGLPAISEATRTLAFGDVDGDGDLDLAMGSTLAFAGGRTRILLNDGGGGFTIGAEQLSVPGFPEEVRFADLDGDADLDLLVARSNSLIGVLNSYFRNDGAGELTNVSGLLPADQDNTLAVTVGDVNADGVLDVLFGNGAAGLFIPVAQNRLYLGDGAGGFTDGSSLLPAVDDETTDLALGDLNGDGLLDLFVANTQLGNTAGNRILLGVGGGQLVDASGAYPLLAESTRAVELLDLDGDGDLDALLGNDEQQNRLYLNDGAGGLVSSTSGLPDEVQESRVVAAGDVDGDGFPDLLIGDDGKNRLLLNDGTGSFVDATDRLPDLVEATDSLALVDLDGDGDLDAVIGNGSTAGGAGPDRIYLNDGTGTFADSPGAVPDLPGWSRGLAVGDVDGDGDPDLVFGKASAQNALYLNDGNAVFSDATALLPVENDATRDVALGDVDGDGDLDLVTTTTVFNGVVRLYLNTPEGFVAANELLPAVTGSTLGVALGDVDADGDLDVMSVTGAFNGIRLFLNDGTGQFSNASFLVASTSVDTAEDVALADLDGDGDLDAVVTHAFGSESGFDDTPIFLRGGGDGTFVEEPVLPALAGDFLSVVLTDVDRDGDPDVVMPGYEQQDRIFYDLDEQLSRRELARIGRPLHLDLRGLPNGIWLLAFSPGTGELVLPGLEGTYFLDVLTSFLLGGGALDASGAATSTLVIPSDPTLVGAEVSWQAVVSLPSGFGLTNREATLFGDL